MKNFAAEINQKILKAEQILSDYAEEDAQFDILHYIINTFLYKDIIKAKSYLALQQQIVERNPTTEYSIAYLTNLARLSNLEYNFEQSESRYLHVINLLDEKENIKTKIEIFLDIAAIYSNQKRFTLAGKYLNIASRLLDRNPDTLLQAYLQTRLANFYLELGNYAEAVELFTESEELFDQYEGIPPLKAINFSIMIAAGKGRIYERQNNFQNAIKSYRQALNICETYGIMPRISHHYVNIGAAYLALADIENAEFFLRKSLEFQDDTSDFSKALAYSNLGKCSIIRGDFNQAIGELVQAKELFKQNSSDDYFNFSSVENFLAELYANVGKSNKTAKHLEKALKYAEKSKNPLQISTISSNLAEFYSKEKNYEKAFFYQKKSENALLNHLHKSKEEEIDRLGLIRDIEKSRHEAKLERMRVVQLQHRALRAQMNPHFMFNLLNAIQADVNAGDIDTASNNLSKFANLMRESLEYSDKEVITLESEIEFLHNYLNLNQKLRYGNRIDYRIEIDDEVETDLFGVPSMIVQPYVENAIEHGLKSIENGLLLIKFAMYDDDNILCIVEDNGVGRQVAHLRKTASNSIKKHRSMGTMITEGRLRFLHEDKNQQDLDFVKTIDLYDANNIACGTRVEVIIPILEISKSQFKETAIDY